MAGHEERTEVIVNLIESRASDADSWLAQTQALVTQVGLALEESIAALEALGITINTGGVDTVYVPPTAVAPTIPTANDVAIGDTEWDRIMARGAVELARIGVAEEHAAASEATLRGLAVPSVVLTGMVSVAQQRTADRLSTMVGTSVVEQAKAAREDIIALTKLSVDSYMQQWQSVTNSERTRLAFETLELQKNVDPARITAEWNLKRTELEMQNSVGQLIQLLQVYGQLTNSLLSSSDVGLTSSANTSISPHTYNPTEGEVLYYPI